ncbi:MAG: hypothetical protein Q9167_000611 [Letrouitia subvulpina]
MGYLIAVGGLATITGCYLLYGVLYRLYLSPIAAIPGPKLAALTFWYEFFYDVVLYGRYGWKISELHEQYGPIIRINPYEVHINDPDFYDEVYVGANKRKTNLWWWSVPMFGTPNSILATVEHDVHRRRRNAYTNYFSKQSVKRYSSVIQAAVDKLCSKFSDHEAAGKPINLMHAYTAMTGDVVTEYCFPASYNLLSHSDFSSDYFKLWISIASNSHVLKQFPWIFPMMLSFPIWFVERFLPDLAVSYRWQRVWIRQIEAIKSGADHSREKRGGRPSIFETLLDSDLPPYDKSVGRLMEDAQTVVGAGSITTSLALALANYYILTEHNVLEALLQELESAIPDPTNLPPLEDLEKLQYLSAVVLETLRISCGVCHRLQRVAPNHSIRYNDYVLPPGTPVSMTSMLIHDNPQIFPEPRKFKPERWMPLDTEGMRLQKYLVAFSKGSRQCLGMNLGSAELYVGIAGVIRRFGRRMTFVDTVFERDVAIQHDIFIPTMAKESEGIKVMINRE